MNEGALSLKKTVAVLQLFIDCRHPSSKTNSQCLHHSGHLIIAMDR